MSDFDELNHENMSRPEMLVTLAERKMNRLGDELEMWKSITGQVFESLPLSGDLNLQREVAADGTRGAIEMSYQVTGALGFGNSWYERVKATGDGKIVYAEASAGGQFEGQPLTGFRKAIIAFKLLKGRPDHWDRETDFNGDYEEED